MPGWDKLSFGYHSDDGKVYEQQAHASKNCQQSETCTHGDVVVRSSDRILVRMTEFPYVL